MQFLKRVAVPEMASCHFRQAILVCLVAMLTLCMCADAHGAPAARKKAGPPSAKTRKQPAAPKKAAPSRPVETPLPEHSTFCIEAGSGLVISEQNADIQRPPASMLKMMLMLLVAEGMHEGKWSPDTPITVTKHAQGMGGTQVFLKDGEVFKLSELMSAVCVASANDAAMAVAEGLWGSEDACKKRMNERAVELGMMNTKYNSVHGLPPDTGEDRDVATARDMARLGQFCVLDPTIMGWASQKEVVFRPGEDPKQNTNKLLGQMADCDGIKTGYTRGAGFCITATAMRNGIRLIAVVMGADGKRDRFELGKELLDQGFAQVGKKRVIAKGDPVGEALRVTNCETEKVRLAAADDVTVVVKNEDASKLEIKVLEAPTFLEAPIRAGTPLAEASVQLSGKEIGRVALVSPADLPEAGWRWKLVRSVRPRADAAAGTK